MTLGKKLSNYRKIAGLTQQQLAEHLNISAQAISKWENDLSEPDLATLKALAKLYNTSVDSLLDTDELTPHPHMIDTEAVANSVYEKIGDQISAQPIGFCMNCGKPSMRIRWRRQSLILYVRNVRIDLPKRLLKRRERKERLRSVGLSSLRKRAKEPYAPRKEKKRSKWIRCATTEKRVFYGAWR